MEGDETSIGVNGTASSNSESVEGKESDTKMNSQEKEGEVDVIPKSVKPEDLNPLEKIKLAKGRWLTVEDLSKLLKDRTFTDFFNVFLNLPIFTQRLTYKYEEKDFVFDPPLKRTKHILDKRKLVEWLVCERLRYFVKTDLALQYTICKELLSLNPTLTPSSHNVLYDDQRKAEDSLLVEEFIGHAIGMCKFKSYLSSTPGDKVYQCLLDLKRFERLSHKDVRTRWLKFRELQLKYFRSENRDATGTEKSMWDCLSDGGGLFELSPTGIDYEPEFEYEGQTQEEKADIEDLFDENKTIKEDDIDDSRFQELQHLLLAVIKDYWLQKYILHCQAVKGKKDRSCETPHKINSQSDLAILKDMRNIDKALALLQGNLKPGLKIRVMKARMNWRAMFPEHQVDDTFLDNNDEIVTVHNQGTITLNRMDSEKFDLMMQKYASESPDSDPEFSSDQNLVASAKDLSKKISKLNRSKSVMGRSASKMKRNSTSDILLRRINQAEEDTLAAKVMKSNLSLLERYLDLNFETIPMSWDDGLEKGRTIKGHKESTKGKEKKAKDNDDDSKRKPNLRIPKIKKLKKSVKVSETEQIWDVEVQIQDSCERNQSATPSSLNGSALPSIKEENIFIGSMQRTHNSIVTATPNFKYKNMSQGYYRYDNRNYLCSVLSDALAGKPFLKFLQNKKQHQLLDSFSFWKDAQEYLSSKGMQRDNLGEYIRYRRAKVLLSRYLQPSGQQSIVCLPPGLMLMLQKLLPSGKGDDLIRDAQDIAMESLRKAWKSFSKRDMAMFCMNKVQKRGSFAARSESVSPWFDSPRPIKTQRDLTEQELHQDIASAMESHDSEERSTTSEMTKTLALQFAMHLHDSHEEGLPLEELNIQDVVFDYDNPHGSLAVKKLVIVHRRDLVEEQERQRRNEAQAQAAHQAALEEIKKAKQLKIASKVDDSIPFYKKPFRQGGRWFYRPMKPRSFAEVLRDPVHLEFFKRYMMFRQAEVPILFYIAVDEMKKGKDAKFRQQKLNQIMRRYFSATSGKGVEALKCNAEVVREISKMEKVSPAMLVSAQACVARSIEENWAQEYLDTFLDVTDHEMVSSTLKALFDSKKQFGKSRTKILWQQFVRSVYRFRQVILDPQECRKFEEFLRLDAKKEIEKQSAATGQSFAPGIPVKKVIKNRLIDVTKLNNDVNFLAEAERYRTMCDDLTDAAKSGDYSIHDQRIIDMKAKTIIDCFIDSELPPKIQINTSQEVAESIAELFKNNIIERGLFHEATLTIFPTLCWYYKRYQTHRIANMFRKSLESTPGAPMIKLHRPATPDYMNIGSLKSKRVTTGHEDDQAHILFSLAHGARYVVPINRRELYNSRASVFYAEGIPALPDEEGLLRQGRRKSTLHSMRRLSMKNSSFIPGKISKLPMLQSLPDDNSDANHLRPVSRGSRHSHREQGSSLLVPIKTSTNRVKPKVSILEV